MKKLLKLWLIVSVVVGFAGSARADSVSKSDLAFAQMYRKAVALLVGKNEQGVIRQACTATPFEREGRIVRFISAAHCVAEDDTDNERVKLERGIDWYLTFDEGGPRQVLYRAKLVAVGYQSRQDDFVVSEAEIDEKESVPLIPFARLPARMLESIVNVASPQGFGKQVFTGHVTSERLERPVQVRDINWKNAILLQMAAGGGSSGSAIVSLEQNGIIAFLVGTLTDDASMNIVAIPAERFHKFWAMSKSGKYRWYRAETEDDGDPLDCFCKMKPDGTKDASECFCRERGVKKKPSETKKK